MTCIELHSFQGKCNKCGAVTCPGHYLNVHDVRCKACCPTHGQAPPLAEGEVRPVVGAVQEELFGGDA